jgi:midasin (ATPase involved in ribosome maturation)
LPYPFKSLIAFSLKCNTLKKIGKTVNDISIESGIAVEYLTALEEGRRRISPIHRIDNITLEKKNKLFILNKSVKNIGIDGIYKASPRNNSNYCNLIFNFKKIVFENKNDISLPSIKTG